MVAFSLLKADCSSFVFRNAALTKFINAPLSAVSRAAWPPELSQIAQINLAASSCLKQALAPSSSVSVAVPLGLGSRTRSAR